MSEQSEHLGSFSLQSSAAFLPSEGLSERLQEFFLKDTDVQRLFINILAKGFTL